MGPFYAWWLQTPSTGLIQQRADVVASTMGECRGGLTQPRPADGAGRPGAVISQPPSAVPKPHAGTGARWTSSAQAPAGYHEEYRPCRKSPIEDRRHPPPPPPMHTASLAPTPLGENRGAAASQPRGDRRPRRLHQQAFRGRSGRWQPALDPGWISSPSTCLRLRWLQPSAWILQLRLGVKHLRRQIPH